MANAAGDALDIPIYGSHYLVSFPILDADGDPVTGASALDSEVSIDLGTFADCTNEAVEIATSSGIYYLYLTGAEMTGKIITVQIKTSSSGAKTTVLTIHPQRMEVIASGTAQAGAAGTITLAASTSKQDNDLAGLFVRISNNTPSGAQYQTRRIISNVASTQVATIESNWGTNPSSSSTYELLMPVTANAASWAGTLPPSIATAGIADGNTKNAGNTAWGSGAITSGVFASGAITASAIGADAITAAKVADGTIDAATFAAGAINAAAIAADAITAAKIADAAIDAATFAAGAISSTAFAAGAITASAIASDAITAAKIADGAIDAATFAAGAINAAAIGADAITAAKIADGAIDAATFATGAITAGAIAADAITAAKVADGAIDAATFAPGAINAAAIADAAIDAATFASGAITASSIAADAITAAKIADGAIDAATFAAGAINAAAIASNAIDADALATDAVTEIQTGLSTLTQADIRTAIGMGAADLDAQLDAINSLIQNDIDLNFVPSGTVASTTGSTTTLDSGVAGTANYHIGDVLYIYANTGVGQWRVITAYSSARVATHDAWTTNPNGASRYKIISGKVFAVLLGTQAKADVQAALTAQGYTTTRAPYIDNINVNFGNTITMATRWLGMVELSGSLYRYTVAAVANAPSGTGGGEGDSTENNVFLSWIRA